MPNEITAAGDFLAIGLLARIAAISTGDGDGKVAFASLRDSTRLLPEKLVAALDELRFGGYIELEENAAGNQFGSVVLTDNGRQWAGTFGEEARQILDVLPKHYLVSSPERSTRRGERRRTTAEPAG